MTRYERQLKAAKDELARYADEIQGLWDKADADGRPTSEAENLEIDTRRKAVNVLKEKVADLEQAIQVEKDIVGLGQAQKGTPDGLEFTDRAFVNPAQVKTPGQAFVESAAYKAMVDKKGGRFTESVSLDTKSVAGFETKGTLLEGSSSPGSGSGGGLLATPQVLPGVVNKLFQRLSVDDLLPQGATDGNTIRYMVEGTATSGAAGVAEGGAKPQSTLGIGTRDEPVKKIATSLVVSDEMLEDAQQVASYINGRLSLFVQIERERQLARGAGTNEIYGFLDSNRGINIYAGGTAAGNKAVQLFKALNGTRGSAFLEPEAIILHPTDWQEIRLLTDTAGQFFGGGPFQGQYGNGSNVQASGQVTGAEDYLWNKPVIVTTALGNAGTALLGAFAQASQIFTKQGVTVEATNSHDTYFLSNLVAIRAEKREALAVYRPSAFTRVDLA